MKRVYGNEQWRHGCQLFAKDGILTGFILVGDVRRAGIYTALIRNRTPLGSMDVGTVKREPPLPPFVAPQPLPPP